MLSIAFRIILLNRKLPDGQVKPISHKGNNRKRDGEIITKEELYEFGLALLVVYLHKQKGELLYVWVKTEIHPVIPSILSIENHEEVCKLSNQFNAIMVFAGMRMTCAFTEEKNIPAYGAGYIAE